jgi:hypothetical protein
VEAGAELGEDAAGDGVVVACCAFALEYATSANNDALPIRMARE